MQANTGNTGNTAALLVAAEDWLLHEELPRPAGETTIERLMYAAHAEAEEALFAALAGRLTSDQGTALDALRQAIQELGRLAKTRHILSYVVGRYQFDERDSGPCPRPLCRREG